MDIKITCCDCGNDFTFTEGEQKFFANNNLNIPKRCKKCRKENFPKPYMKKSSLFDHIKIFGPDVNVSGGLYIVHHYYIKSDKKGFLALKGNKLFFLKELTPECFNSIDRSQAEKVCENFNKKYNQNCKLWPFATYVNRAI